jgi:hypothetical protein
LCGANLLLFFLPAHRSLRKVHVNILSYHEGKEDVTKAAQTFCTKVKNKEAQSKIMNIEHLSKLLEGNNNCQVIVFEVSDTEEEKQK